MSLAKETGYWVAVVLIAIVGIALFKLLAGVIGDRIPGLTDLAAFV